MLSLYGEILDQYLVPDIKKTIFSMMFTSLPQSFIDYIRPEGVNLINVRLADRMPPSYGKASGICYTCNYYSLSISWFAGIEYRSTEVHSRFKTAIHQRCRFFGITRQECIEYRYFLMAIFPNLTIDLA